MKFIKKEFCSSLDSFSRNVRETDLYNTVSLKDPASAIPKGTLWAIFWTTFSYVMIVVTSGKLFIERGFVLHLSVHKLTC